MSKTNVVLACMGLNVLLIGYVSSPARRQVNGIDSVRREFARDSERRLAVVAATASSAQLTDPAGYDHGTKKQSHTATRPSHTAVEMTPRSAPLSTSSRQLMPAQFANARRAQERSIDGAETAAVTSAGEGRNSSSARAANPAARVIPMQVSSTAAAAAVHTSTETKTPTAALAAEDGFEPVIPEPFHSPGNQDEPSDFERNLDKVPDRQAGILTPEDQQIRALHGWSAFQQFQKERVLQELQEKGA